MGNQVKTSATKIINLVDANKIGPKVWSSPLIFDLKKTEDYDSFILLLKENKINLIHDHIDKAFSELYDIANPNRKDQKTVNDVAEFSYSKMGDEADNYGIWVYYPWSGNCVHYPTEKDLRLLRTARNRLLINDLEQDELYKKTILIVGLSVGSSAVEMLLSEGIGGTFILVDMDIIEPTNLNRIKTVYSEVGCHKVDLMAKKISETDPYIEQVHYKDGLDEQNIQEIIELHKPDIIIDEMDELRMKIILRGHAKTNKIPVLMATDDGENAILDIERYDINEDQLPFDGRLSEEVITKILGGKLSRPEIGMLIGTHFVGVEHVPLRMFDSLVEVGKTIPSWPQLAGAATLSGVALAYASKKILLSNDLVPGRHIFDLDSEMDPEIQKVEYIQKVEKYRDLFFA